MDDGYSGGGGGGFGKGGNQRLMRVMSKGMALADRLHDNDDEEEEGEKDDLMDPLAYFSSRAIPAGMQMEIARMKEERERDQALVDKDACIVDRRVWENQEVGHGYQHRTVVRQAAASFDKVKIRDMTKEKKRKRQAGDTQDDEEDEEEGGVKGKGLSAQAVAGLTELRRLILHTLDKDRRAQLAAAYARGELGEGEGEEGDEAGAPPPTSSATAEGEGSVAAASPRSDDDGRDRDAKPKLSSKGKEKGGSSPSSSSSSDGSQSSSEGEGEEEGGG